VAKLTRNKASTPDVSKQHSSNDIMNFFTCKIENIREKIIKVHCIVPVEKFNSFVAIGEE